MSDRFTDKMQYKNCRKCGEEIVTDDKLLTQCRQCYLDNHGDIR